LTQEDLSRFGRNYIEFGQYTDYLFPSLGCRFIALNNGIDTMSDNGSTDVMCFLNLFNEFYSRDTSKKVKAVKRACAESGKFTGTYPAYQTDMTRVFSIGKLPDRAYRVHRVALEIQARMERTAKPGVPCAELYRDALAMAGQEGLEDCFMGTRFQAKFVGHGVGLEINELPVLTTRSKDILQPGMTFAFEPKFVLAGIGAVGIENTFLVTDSGVEKMTLLDENIIEL